MILLGDDSCKTQRLSTLTAEKENFELTFLRSVYLTHTCLVSILVDLFWRDASRLDVIVLQVFPTLPVVVDVIELFTFCIILFLIFEEVIVGRVYREATLLFGYHLESMLVLASAVTR